MIKLESIVKMRWIYVIGFIFFVTACFVRCTREKPKKEVPITQQMMEISKASCFWPPDIVPHPHPPQPEPRDNNA